MALIGKIRDNSWILIVMIAVGMGGFILQDVMTNQSQRNAGNFELANVNGIPVDYREFQRTEDILYSGATNQDGYSQKASLWVYFTEKAIVDSETEDLGIGVSTEELIDLQFGERLSPIITARFKTQSGVVDRERLNSFRQAIESGDLDPMFRQYWAIQENEIIKDRKQTKLKNLFTQAIYTPDWLAQEISKEANSSAEFEYVKIGFDVIPDDQIEVTDEAVKEYISENKKKFQNQEETRVLKYVEIPVLPTKNDTLVNRNKLSELAEEFASAANDSLFVLNNSGNYTFVYYKPEDLPEPIREEIVNVDVKSVYGPYFDTDKFTLAKLLDKRLVADSVKARHILRAVNPQDPNSLADAREMIDSLKNLLESGAASFDSLAIKFSMDSGSGVKGGDLGYFAQGTMVPPFNHACFFGNADEYQVVNTRFGVHLIEVQDRKFLDNNPKYKVAYISQAIVPTQATQDSLYDLATELVTASESLDMLYQNLNNYEGYELKEATPYKENDYFFMNFGTEPASRNMIRWAFEPGVEPGDVSPVIYTYTDKVNYYNNRYVVIGLDRIYPKGLKSVEEVRGSTEILVANKLKGQKIVEQITNRDLAALAQQFNTKVDTVRSVTFNANFITDLGNEPKVMSLVFDSPINEVAGPVIGNSGVYMVKPLLVNRADQALPNYIQQKNTTENQLKSEAGFRFMDALKKIAEIEDNRYLFY